MSLAKLVVHLQANYKGLTAGLGIARNDIAKTVAHIANVAAQLDTMKGKLNEGAAEYSKLSELSAEFANSTDLAGDAADLLRIKLRYVADTQEKLQAQTERYEQTLTAAVASFQLRLLTDALRRQSQATDTIRRLWNGNNSALVKYNQTAAQTTRMHETMAQSRPALPAQQSQNRGMIKYQGGGSKTQTLLQVAAIAMQARSASVMERAMTRARTAVATVGEAMRTVTSATTYSISTMDRFRLAAMAPKTDPSLNVLKNGVEKVGNAVSETVNKMRAMADATISGIPDTLKETARQSGKLNVELDKTQLTMSKHISKMQTTSKGLTLLSKVFPFASGAIQKIQQPLDAATAKAVQMSNGLDKANATVAATANVTRNAAYVMTGSFERMGGTADLYARAQFHAMLPMRLMKREIDGANRVIRAGMHVWNFATGPIHSLALSVSRSRAEFANLRASLPPLTGGLQLGTRAIRLFSHTTYLTTTAVRPLVLALGTLARASMTTGRALFQLTSVGLRPFIAVGKAAVSTIGRFAASVTSTIAKVTGLSLVVGAATTVFSRLGATTNNTTNVMNSRFTAVRNNYTSLFGGVISKAAMMKTAMLGLAAGAVMWGTSTAMATEKNVALFGSMLHDVQQGKAAVQSIQNTKAAAFFDNQELLDSGRLLYKAGVSADGLAAKTDQFAKIALGASVDVKLLTDRYMQGATAQAFSLGQINDLQREGVAIYAGLEAATGKSGQALQDMISDGKIGITQMDAALAFLTEGHGIYADALTNIGNTAGGMISQMKNNTQQALGQLLGYGLVVFKPILAAGVAFTEQLKAAVMALEPVFSFVFNTVYMTTVARWALMMDAASAALNFIFGEGFFTFDNLTKQIARMFGAASFLFNNLGSVASYAWKTVQLGAVMAFNDIIYFFTDTMPAYLDWFSENWANVFLDAGNVIVTVFSNIVTNIKSAMNAIWAYIKSGGTADLKFAFVPLLDGFQATVAELPNVPERALTELEQQMTAELGTLGAELGGGLQAAMNDAMASLGTNDMPALSNVSSASQPGGGAEQSPTEKAREVENKAVQVRSEEGQKALASLLRSGMKDDKKAAEKIAADSRDHLAKIARNTETAPKLRSRQFAAG
jgi:hypothetical protein